LSDNSLHVVILAAGQGKRMQSSTPKVLQTLAGNSLLGHVLDCAQSLQPTKISVVYGHGAEKVLTAFKDKTIQWVLQSPPQGTGDAVKQVFHANEERESNKDLMLVLYGDVPLIQKQTLLELIELAKKDTLSLLTQTIADPTGYGRIVRDKQGKIRGIVEHKDASAEQRLICEVNTGIVCAPSKRLRHWVSQLSNDNEQGEYYLTDVAALAVEEGIEVLSSSPALEWEAQGINDQWQLSQLERQWQKHLAKEMLIQGTAIMDPDRIEIRGKLHAEKDVRIDIGCVFEGEVYLRSGAQIGPYCVIKDSDIGERSQIKAFTHIEQAKIGPHNQIGPYARVRPGTMTAEEVHIGNFVEIKNSEIGKESKANHLAYVGDTQVGKEVNIGAGVITCNYDGANKHQTIIGDGAFIGSNSQLVAPVTIGSGATIAAGSTIVADAPANQLTLSRAPQRTVASWTRPIKKT